MVWGKFVRVGEKDLNLNTVEYNNILQQAVQEIRTARITIAKQVNSSKQSTYWNLGKLLFNKLQSHEAVLFYATQTIEKGWSRDLLLNAIKMDSFSQMQKQIKTQTPIHKPLRQQH